MYLDGVEANKNGSMLLCKWVWTRRKSLEVKEIACATSSKNVCQSSSLYFPKEDPCAVYIYASVTGLL